jgi:putative membrane protein
MRIVWFGLIVLFALGGLLFGALNSETLGIDFYLFSLSLPKGVALLGAVLVGWLLGGIVVYFGLVLRLNRQLRAARRQHPASTALVELPPVTPTDAA